MLNGLNFIMLHTDDVTEAATFYTEKLGLEIDGPQTPDFVQFKQPMGNGAMLAIGKGERANPGQGIELWWFVDNADAVCATLKERGVQIVDGLKDEPFGRTFSVKDPAGYIVYILQPSQ